MSTILLPAVRRDTANLFRYSTAGVVASRNGTWGSGAFAEFGEADGAGANGDDICRIQLANVGLAAGDKVSARGEVAYDASGETVWLRIRFADAAGGLVSEAAASPQLNAPVGFTEQTIDGGTVPSGATQMQLTATVSGGTGTIQIRHGMINRGPTAQPYDIPKRGADAPWTDCVFEFDRNQSALQYATGIEQVTSYARRLWMTRIALPVMDGAEAREWSHAVHRLTSLGNVFRFAVPEYDGPSTGYRGPNPLVNGAGQTGTSLVCDGVDASTDILGPGDYLSFEVTSPKGNVNVQLARVASRATSDASGNVTFTLETPIRLSPANNAVVQIHAPVAQFRLVQSRGGSSLDRNRVSPFVLDAVEKIFP